MTLVSIEAAAEILQERPGTLRRYCKQGMPHQPGGRGRGKACLVDLQVCREWISAPPDTRFVLALADDIQRTLAASIWKSWEQATKLNRRREAGVFAAIWYQCTGDVLDHLRMLNRETPDVSEPYPPEITELLKIACGN
ncbi:MAG: hypothetical protein HPY82_08370 [Gammaproteobacteria bacterium]|nr:hypothetical protein [Gammaproteobacteria bacterium]